MLALGGVESGLKGGFDSVDCFNGGDARNAIFEVPFDPHSQGHRSRWAPDAGAVHADSDGVLWGDFDEFDIAAVILDGWADAFDDERDLVPERVPGGVWGCGHIRVYPAGGCESL